MDIGTQTAKPVSELLFTLWTPALLWRSRANLYVRSVNPRRASQSHRCNATYPHRSAVKEPCFDKERTVQRHHRAYGPMELTETRTRVLSTKHKEGELQAQLSGELSEPEQMEEAVPQKMREVADAGAGNGSKQAARAADRRGACEHDVRLECSPAVGLFAIANRCLGKLTRLSHQQVHAVVSLLSTSQHYTPNTQHTIFCQPHCTTAVTSQAHGISNKFLRLQASR